MLFDAGGFADELVKLDLADAILLPLENVSSSKLL